MEILTSTLCTEIIPAIAGVLMVITYYPQLTKTFKTKNVEGLSVTFWAVLCVALSCFVINALSLIAIGAGSYGYLIAEILNLSMALAMLIMVLRYRRR